MTLESVRGDSHGLVPCWNSCPHQILTLSEQGGDEPQREQTASKRRRVRANRGAGGRSSEETNRKAFDNVKGEMELSGRAGPVAMTRESQPFRPGDAVVPLHQAPNHQQQQPQWTKPTPKLPFSPGAFYAFFTWPPVGIKQRPEHTATSPATLVRRERNAT